jgi:dTDP-4-amino-4,6-dideoxygalactose transaminase
MVPFNRPHITGREFDYIREAIGRAHLASDGQFSRRCESGWQTVGCRRALLTQSCTAALEMAALVAGIQPGDEVIMPSFTFVSTANAFVLRGGVPVFVDIRSDTLNIDEGQIEAGITERTRAIVPVHYAGVACEMDAIMAIASSHALPVIEDAAQGLGATYRGTPLGRFGVLAATSFHETKNVISGEGGALFFNGLDYVDRAEIVREKGTDRRRFSRGEVDKYTWIDVGSSFAPSELTAAFLWAQMEQAATIRQARLSIWRWYRDAFAAFEERPVAEPLCPIALRAQRAHVLHPPERCREQNPCSPGAECRGHQRRVPLCASAYLESRPKIRTHGGAAAADRERRRASDQAADVDWYD